MYAMMMQNFLKTSAAKQLAAEIKYLEWDQVTFNFYHKSFKGYNFYKRNISLNYWQYTVVDDITSCTFKVYEKEAKTNAKLGYE
jgi:uncharacterized UPF0146 family protein